MELISNDLALERLSEHPQVVFNSAVRAQQALDWAASVLPEFFVWAAAKMVRQMGLQHVSFSYSELAPDNVRGIIHCIEENHHLPIYAGGCERTIYADPMANLLFRKMHDLKHYQHRAGVSPAGEWVVIDSHMHDLREWFDVCSRPLSPADKAVLEAVLWADTAGQVIYYHRYRAFANDQYALVLRILYMGTVPGVNMGSV